MRHLIIGILLTGIIVGSAIATGIAAVYGLDDSEIFATVTFTGSIAATLLAGFLILSSLWRGRRSRR